MSNWSGLLKWSLQHCDGTAPSQIPPLSDERRRWLEEALKAGGRDGVSEVRALAAEIERTAFDEANVADNLSRISALDDILASQDMNINFCKVGAAAALLALALRAETPSELRAALLALVAGAAANSHFVQRALADAEFEGLIALARGGGRTRLRALSALAAIAGGECLIAKRAFLLSGGAEMLGNLLCGESDAETLSRALAFTAQLFQHKAHIATAAERIPSESDAPNAQFCENGVSAAAALANSAETLIKGVIRCIRLARGDSQLCVNALKCAETLQNERPNAELAETALTALNALQSAEISAEFNGKFNCEIIQ